MNLPWKVLLSHGPTIVEAARVLYRAARTPAAERPAETAPGGTGDSLDEAVARLAEREAQQAARVADLATRVEALTAALEILRARVALVLLGAAVAGALALAAIALVVWRGP